MRKKIILFILLFSLVLFLLSCSSQSSAEREFHTLVGKVEKINVELRNKHSKLMEQIREFNKKHPDIVIDTLAKSVYGLSDEESKILAERIKQEQDITTKGLLSEIVALNKQIEELNKKMEEMSEALPPPHVVAKGESHFQICLDYLTKEAGFSKDSAIAVLEKVAQFDELIPGFYVWHFIDKKTGTYLTTVTQGEAKISPNQLKRITKRKIAQERQALLQSKSELEAQVAELEQRKQKLQRQLEAMGKELGETQEQVRTVTAEKEKVTQEREELQTRLNTMYYTVGSETELKKSGALKRPFLGKLKEADLQKVEYSKSQDLSKTNIVWIRAEDVRLNAIQKVTVYPTAMYQINRDYKVTIEGKQAKVEIINLDRFKGANVIFAVQ
ncbi:MAG: hypothetical protein N2450_06915 [bacterium]|nr:hypothetical protein [bacterium]